MWMSTKKRRTKERKKKERRKQERRKERKKGAFFPISRKFHLIRGNPVNKVCLILRSLTSRTFTQTQEVTEDASGLVTWVGLASIFNGMWLMLSLLGFACYDLGKPQVLVIWRKEKMKWVPMVLLSTCGNLLNPYLSVCGHWCNVCSILATSVLFWMGWECNTWAYPETSILFDAWLLTRQVGKTIGLSVLGLTVVSPCSFSTIHVDVLFTMFCCLFWMSILRRIRCLTCLCTCAGNKQQITKSEVKLVGGHPLIFTFLSMALCGALCYTENSTTAKLDFDKRHWD